MKPVLLRLPDDLAAAVDEVAGDVPRERWIRRLLEREPAIAKILKRNAPKRAPKRKEGSQ